MISLRTWATRASLASRVVLLLLLVLGACAPGAPPPPAPSVAPATAPLATAPATHTVNLPLVVSGTPVGPPPSPTPTPIPSPTPGPLVFAVIGDYGTGDQNEADVAALVDSWDPDLILTTGDNNYPNGAAATIDDHIGQFYQAYIHPYQGAYGPGGASNRFFPSLGNHDWNTPNAQPYLDYFALPGNERYYDFVRGPVHFFALDSDTREPDGVGLSSAQAAWLQAQMAQASAPWKIVYMHHPPYSSGWHGSIDWMQWPFGNWGASAVLAGHDHTYERLEVGGLLYLVNGLGGAGRYIFGPPVAGSQVRFNSDHGAIRATATDTQLTFEFITHTGQLVDTHTLTAAAP